MFLRTTHGYHKLALVLGVWLATHLSVGVAQHPVPEEVPLPPKSAPVMRLTLGQAKELALRNNKALILARMNIDEKRWTTKAAKSNYFPQIFGNFTYLRFNDDLGTVLTARTGRLGILPVGTRQTSVNLFNRESSFTTIATVQPITKLLAIHGVVQIAKADERIACAQADKATRQVLSGVTQAYHGLLAMQRLHHALTVQIQAVEEANSAQPSPLLRIAALQAKQGLVEAESQMKQLNETLNTLLALPGCTVIQIVDPIPQPVPVQCVQDVIEMALNCHPDIREARETISKAQSALKITNTNYLPDVYLFGGFQNQQATDVVQESYSMAGITASYTFVDWGKRRHTTRKTQLLVAMACQKLRVTVDTVKLDAQKAYAEYTQASRAFDLSQQLLAASKEAEEAAGKKVEEATKEAKVAQEKAKQAAKVSAEAAKVIAGLAAAKVAATTFAFAKAKEGAATAELGLIQAELNYRLAHAKLMNAIGHP